MKLGLRYCSGFDWLLAGIAAALLVSLGTQWQSLVQLSRADQEGLPRIAIENERCDLGYVDTANQREAVFWVRNEGSRRLILHRRASSCPCALAKESEVIVPPYARARLPVVVDAKEVQGRMRLEAHYETNDPRTPCLRLLIFAESRKNRDPVESAKIVP